MRSDSGRSVLATISGGYANHLFLARRFDECRKIATHAIELYSHLPRNDDNLDRAIIRQAEVSADCGSRQGLNSAISLLRQWVHHTSHTTFTGWILSDLAFFHAASGQTEEALRLGRESLRMATHLHEGGDFRHYDFIRLLLQVGRVEEAQEKVLAYDYHPYFLLVQAEVAQQSGMQTDAHRYIERIRTYLDTPLNISQPEIRFYRPLVDALANQLEANAV